MAQRPLRPCKHPGCRTLTADTWCDAHRPARTERGAESASWQWLYNTDLWRKQLRPEQLLREPWCRECARRGLRVPATEVDHITDHRGDPKLFAEVANLQSLCHGCHSRKTLAEMRRNRKKAGRS